MKHLDLIESVAKKVGLETRRYQVREFEVIHVMNPNGEWSLFDPISQGKDIAKLLYAWARMTNVATDEMAFRTTLLTEILKS